LCWCALSSITSTSSDGVCQDLPSVPAQKIGRLPDARPRAGDVAEGAAQPCTQRRLHRLLGWSAVSAGQPRVPPGRWGLVCRACWVASRPLARDAAPDFGRRRLRWDLSIHPHATELRHLALRGGVSEGHGQRLGAGRTCSRGVCPTSPGLRGCDCAIWAPRLRKWLWPSLGRLGGITSRPGCSGPGFEHVLNSFVANVCASDAWCHQQHVPHCESAFGRCLPFWVLLIRRCASAGTLCGCHRLVIDTDLRGTGANCWLGAISWIQAWASQHGGPILQAQA